MGILGTRKHNLEDHEMVSALRGVSMVGGSRREGLTLLELVIVLVVLAALGGIILPLIPNLLPKAHVAVCATNIPELNKAVQSYATLNLRHPSQYDSLVDINDQPYGGLPFIGEVGTFPADLFQVRPPTGPEVNALLDLGIVSVVVGPEYTLGQTNATFDYQGPPITLSTATSLLFVNPLHVQQVLNAEAGVIPPVGTYVAFGVGPTCTLVGQANGGIAEAPIHFSETEGGNPARVYARYFVIYRVDGNTARYMGAAAPSSGGLENVNDHLAEFYE